ncbi:MAG: Bug family tripartite tricarboxylate transporter substrate binding protein [Usitatibacter sp.]
MKTLLRTALAVAVTVAASVAPAQENWPSRPVKLVVPSSPGGGTDVFARLLAVALTDAMGQQFIVENRPGASGTVGAQAVASAPRDGYTFLVAANASIAINPAFLTNPGYERDLAPVGRGVMAVNVLVVNPATGIRDLDDLVARAKKQPETLAFGSAGTGTSLYLGVRMIEEAGGVKFLHVPYKGIGPAYQDLLAGRLQFMYTDLASAIPYVSAGRIKALAVDRKTPLLPNVPTFAEAGWPTIDSPTSFSVMAPSGVAPAVLQKMASEVAKALKMLAPRLEQQALVPVFDTPAEFAVDLARERAHWASFIKRNGITADQ